MKVTKAQAKENRDRIVEVASVLFRERGFDGIGVADLMAAAGLTHGGFYKHFKSKADLMAEATACSFSKTAEQSSELNVSDFIEKYLSREHRDTPGYGCTMAALSGDAGRQPESVKQTFAIGIENILTGLAANNSALTDIEQQAARADRIAAISQLVGAIMLSRACPDDSSLADEILEVCRNRFMGGDSERNKKNDDEN